MNLTQTPFLTFLLSSLLPLAGLTCVSSGCSANGKGLNYQDIALAKEAIQLADDAGLAAYVELELGQPGIIIQQKYGIDLGVKLKLMLMARPGGSHESTLPVPIPMPLDDPE